MEVFQVFLKVKEAVEEYHYKQLPNGDIPPEVWRRMLRAPIFQQEYRKAAREIESGSYRGPALLNVALLTQVGLTAYDPTALPAKKRASFAKPTARRRYQAIVLHVRDSLSRYLTCTPVLPDLVPECVEKGFSVRLTPAGATFAVGSRVVRRSCPSWPRLLEGWVAEHPEEKLKSPASLRRLYSRAYRQMGVNPDGQDLPNPLLVFMGATLKIWHPLFRTPTELGMTDSQAAAYYQANEPYYRLAKVYIEAMRILLDSGPKALIFDKSAGLWRQEAVAAVAAVPRVPSAGESEVAPRPQLPPDWAYTLAWEAQAAKRRAQLKARKGLPWAEAAYARLWFHQSWAPAFTIRR